MTGLDQLGVAILAFLFVTLIPIAVFFCVRTAWLFWTDLFKGDLW